MGPTDSKLIQDLHLGQETDTNFKYNTENGLRFKRVFSKEGQSPYDSVEYEKRLSIIREPDGTVVFEMKDIDQEFEEFVKLNYKKLTKNQKEICQKLGLIS